MDNQNINKLEDLFQKIQEFFDNSRCKFNDQLDEKFTSYEILGYTYTPSQILEKVDPLIYKSRFDEYKKAYIITFMVELENIKFNKRCVRCQELKNDMLKILNNGTSEINNQLLCRQAT